EWIFSENYATETLLKHFDTLSLKGFGIEGMEAGIIAAGAALHYLKETEHPNISHISSVQRIDQDTFLWMDKFTIRNLELLQSAGEKGHCLLNVLDHTLTPMGSRMLKRWMVFPLREIRKINERLDLVTFFIKDQDIANVLRRHLKLVGDMERVVSKIPLKKISPREVLQLAKGLQQVEEIKVKCKKMDEPYIVRLVEQLNPCQQIRDRVFAEIVEKPPSQAEIGRASCRERG